MLVHTQPLLALAVALVACGAPGHAVDLGSNTDSDGDTPRSHARLATPGSAVACEITNDRADRSSFLPGSMGLSNISRWTRARVAQAHGDSISAPRSVH